jgi:hypothetical protein
MKYIFYVITILLFAACSSDPVPVFVNAQPITETKIYKLIIDKTDTIELKKDTITLLLKPGKHNIVFGNKPVQDFEVGENGGILNLGNQEYIAYEVLYGESSSIEYEERINKMQPKAIIQIGEYLYMSPGIEKQVTDKYLRKILPTLASSKNGNFMFTYNTSNGYNKDTNIIKGDLDYDTNEKVRGFKKFGKDKLFINKFWDYGLNETLPETIKETSTGYMLINTTNKIALMPKTTFMLLGLLGKETVTITAIADIEAGLRDAERAIKKEKQQKENEKKHLEF